MQDITPTLKAGKKSIESYGGGGFKISGTRYDHSLIVMPDSVFRFDINDIENASPDAVKIILDNADEIEVLLVGSGEDAKFFSPDIEKTIKQKRISIEYMNTGAAARTYNILLSEERKVAVILIAV